MKWIKITKRNISINKLFLFIIFIVNHLFVCGKSKGSVWIRLNFADATIMFLLFLRCFDHFDKI